MNKQKLKPLEAPMPIYKHEGKELTKEEVMESRSSAYEFINFDKKDLKEHPLKPNECFKQETLEEVAERYYNNFDKRKEEFAFIDGAKWQQERSYSEEEVLVMLSEIRKGSMVTSSINNRTYWEFDIKSTKEWFEKFKKK